MIYKYYCLVQFICCLHFQKQRVYFIDIFYFCLFWLFVYFVHLKMSCNTLYYILQIHIHLHTYIIFVVYNLQNYNTAKNNNSTEIVNNFFEQ